MALIGTKLYRKLTCLIILIALFCCSINVVAQTGPANITKYEGDEDVIIPCPFSGPATPYWRINTTTYHISQIEFPFTPLPNGNLFINLIYRMLNNTSFQCFAAPGTVNDPTPLQSSVGILTVIPINTTIFPSGTGGSESNIKLINQHLRFSRDNVTLAWGVFDTLTRCNLSPNNGSYTLSISDCNPQDVSSQYNVSNTMTTIPTEGLAGMYLNISTYPDADITIYLRFQIKSGVVTNELLLYEGSNDCINSCIEVPEEEKGPFMTFAASSTSSKSDIECQVVPSSFESIAIDQCLTLSNRCGGRSDESIYTDSIKICNISMRTNICFQNISREMNNTLFNFFYSQTPPCPSASTDMLRPTRVYIASYKIITVATNYSVCINATAGEICVTSQRNSFQQFRYNISITDVTGHLTYNRFEQEDANNMSCIRTRVFEQAFCAPFEVQAQVLDSQSVQILNYNTRSNNASPCRCASKKVHFQWLERTQENDSSIQYHCSHLYLTDVYITLEIDEAENFTGTLKSREIIKCTNGSTKINGKMSNYCGGTYSVVAFLDLPRSGAVSQCELSRSEDILNSCLNVTEPYTSGSEITQMQSIPLEIILPTSIILPFVFIVVSIIVCLVIANKRVRSKWREYSPCKAERIQQMECTLNLDGMMTDSDL